MASWKVGSMQLFCSLSKYNSYFPKYCKLQNNIKKGRGLAWYERRLGKLAVCNFLAVCQNTTVTFRNIATCKLALKREGDGLVKKGPLESWQSATFWQFAKIQQLLSKILQVAK